MALSDSIQKNIKEISDLIGYVQKLESTTKTVSGVTTSSFDLILFALKELKNQTAITDKAFVKLSDGIHKAIEEEQSMAKFTALTTDALVKEAAAVTKSYEAFEKNTTAKSKDNAISKQLNGIMIESVNAIGKKSDALKQLSTYYKEIEVTQKKAAASNKAALQQQKSQTIAYQNANKQALATQKQQALATQKASAAHLKNTQAVQANKNALQKFKQQTIASNKAMGKQIALGNQSSGMFSRLSKTMKGGLQFFGITAGLTALKSFISGAYELTKQLDSLNFAMEATIGAGKELGQTQEWLIKMSDDFGADIMSTTERYIKFRAASDAAGFSARQTQKIFETMTKVSGVLGLKTDELRGVYLALEQMISKGKITTEELRRQLGERLPGAMDIMAKSMKVSTRELDEMLKKGEVITKDVLPAFAREVEKTFGLETIEKINTLQAKQTRLSNTWIKFIKDIAGSDTILNNAFIAILDFTQIILDSITDIDDKLKNALKSDLEKARTKELDAQAKLYEKTRKTLEESDDLTLRLYNSQKKEQEMLSKINKIIQQSTKEQFIKKGALEDISKIHIDDLRNLIHQEAVFKSLTKEQRDQLYTMGIKLKAAQEVTEATFNELTMELDMRTRNIGMIDNEIAEAKKLQSTISETNKDWVRYQNIIIELEAERRKITGEILKDKKKINEEEIKYVKNSEPSFKKSIKALEKLQDQTAVGSDEWKMYDAMIKVLVNTLKLLKGELKDVEEEVDEVTKADKFKDLMENVSKFADAIGGFGDAIFDRRIENINAEIEAETNKYDKLLALAEDDMQQKKRLEYEKQATLDKLEKERLKKEQQKAKFNKAQALVDIAINTAVAISAAPKESLIFGLAAIPVLAALGAIQAATVLAQPIPQYKDGLELAKKDHVGMINDGGVKEYLERDGEFYSTNKKDAIVGIKKGDRIHKDYDAVKERLVMLSLMNGGAQLNPNNKELSDVIEQGFEKGFRKAKFNNNIKLNGFNYNREAYKNKLQSFN